MSGTAALSSAKNRRSGNEVKINGQIKSLPPPQNTRQQQQQQQPQQHQQHQQPQQPQRPPHPLEILKSHELRLRVIENNKDESSKNENVVSSNDDDINTLKSDIYLLKTTLKTQVEDLNKLISTLSTKMIDVANSVNQHSDLIGALRSCTCTCNCNQLPAVETSVSSNSENKE